MDVADRIHDICDRMMEELPLDSLVVIASLPDGTGTSRVATSRGNAYANKTITELTLKELEDALYETDDSGDDDDPCEQWQ